MKKNEKGFSAVEILIAVVVIGLIFGLGWKIYTLRNDNLSVKSDSTNSQTSSQTEAIKAYERTTTVPKDWKTSSNEKYKFSFAYPADWKVSESVTNKKAGQEEQNVFSLNATEIFVVCYKSPEAQQWCPAQINISNQSFEESVTQVRKYFEDSAETNPYTETKLTLDGHEAVVFERKSKVENQPGEKQYLVGANGYTYSLPIVYDAPLIEADGTQHLNALESLQLFESVRIK